MRPPRIVSLRRRPPLRLFGYRRSHVEQRIAEMEASEQGAAESWEETVTSYEEMLARTEERQQTLTTLVEHLKIDTQRLRVQVNLARANAAHLEEGVEMERARLVVEQSAHIENLRTLVPLVDGKVQTVNDQLRALAGHVVGLMNQWEAGLATQGEDQAAVVEFADIVAAVFGADVAADDIAVTRIDTRHLRLGVEKSPVRIQVRGGDVVGDLAALVITAPDLHVVGYALARDGQSEAVIPARDVLVIRQKLVVVREGYRLMEPTDLPDEQVFALRTLGADTPATRAVPEIATQGGRVETQRVAEVSAAPTEDARPSGWRDEMKSLTLLPLPGIQTEAAAAERHGMADAPADDREGTSPPRTQAPTPSAAHTRIAAITRLRRRAVQSPATEATSPVEPPRPSAARARVAAITRLRRRVVPSPAAEAAPPAEPSRSSGAKTRVAAITHLRRRAVQPPTVGAELPAVAAADATIGIADTTSTISGEQTVSTAAADGAAASITAESSEITEGSAAGSTETAVASVLEPDPEPVMEETPAASQPAMLPEAHESVPSAGEIPRPAALEVRPAASLKPVSGTERRSALRPAAGPVPTRSDTPMATPSVLPRRAAEHLSGPRDGSAGVLPSPVWALEVDAPESLPVVGAAPPPSPAPTAAPLPVAPLTLPLQAAPPPATTVSPAAPAAEMGGLSVLAFLDGKIVGQDITSSEGKVVAARGDVITRALVERVEAIGKLPELIVYMTLPGVGG